MALSTKLVAQVVATLTNDLDLADGTVPLNYVQRLVLGSGTGADQADTIWHDQRTLAPSTGEDLDLAGVLVDAFGNTVTLARVKALVVASAAANGADLAVGGGGVNSFVGWVADASDILNVRPGGALALYAPDATAYPVTAGTGDLLRIANTDAVAAATYDVVVIGASA